MFRVSPCDGWAWMRPDDDDYNFTPQVPFPVTFDNFGPDHPAAYGYPTYRTSRRPQMTHSAFVPPPGYLPRRHTRRRQNFAPASAAAVHDPYDMFEHHPYAFHSYRRPAAPESDHYHVPFRLIPQPAAASGHDWLTSDDFGDDHDDDHNGDDGDENGVPILFHNGRGYALRPPTVPHQLRRQRQQQQKQQQPVVASRPQPLAPPNMPANRGGGGGGGGFSSSDGDDADASDHIECRQTRADVGDASKRSMQPQAVLFWDPRTGRCFRGVTGTGKGEKLQQDSLTKATKKPSRSKYDSTTAVAGPPASRANLTAATRAGPSGINTGPTRIQVVSVGGDGTVAAKVPVVSTAGGKAAKVNVADPKPETAPTVAAAASSCIERNNSSALITRPTLEVALSRGPSTVLPAATAATAAAAAATASAAASASTTVPTSGSSQSSASSKPKTSQSAHLSNGPFAAAAGAAGAAAPCRMTRSQAARTIQRWWRGWRLWRHKPALKQLMSLAAELRDAGSLYYSYMGATDGNITNKQEVEVNELAMRAILKLDSLEGLPLELRALRKHLTARALRLQDEVHNAYAKSTTRFASVRQGLMDSTSAVPTVDIAEAAAAAAVEEVAADEQVAGQESLVPSPVECPDDCDVRRVNSIANYEAEAATVTAIANVVVAAAAMDDPTSSAPSTSAAEVSEVDGRAEVDVDEVGKISEVSMVATSVTTPCVRHAVHGINKRLRPKRSSSGDSGGDAPTGGSRRHRATATPSYRLEGGGDEVDGTRVKGLLCLLRRLRGRRFGISGAVVAARAAAAAAAAVAGHLPPPAADGGFKSGESGADGLSSEVSGLRKQCKAAMRKQQQQQRWQQEQQQAVTLQVVVRGNGDDNGTAGDMVSTSGSYRTAVLVDIGVQTD